MWQRSQEVVCLYISSEGTLGEVWYVGIYWGLLVGLKKKRTGPGGRVACFWGVCGARVRFGARPGGTARRGIHLGGEISTFYSMLAALSSASHGIPPFNPASSHLINFKPGEPCFPLVLFNGEMALGESRWFAYSWLCVHPGFRVSVFSLPVRVRVGFGGGQAPASYLPSALRCQGGFVCVTSGCTRSKEPTQARRAL